MRSEGNGQAHNRLLLQKLSVLYRTRDHLVVAVRNAMDAMDAGDHATATTLLTAAILEAVTVA